MKKNNVRWNVGKLIEYACGAGGAEGFCVCVNLQNQKKNEKTLH